MPRKTPLDELKDVFEKDPQSLSQATFNKVFKINSKDVPFLQPALMNTPPRTLVAIQVEPKKMQLGFFIKCENNMAHLHLSIMKPRTMLKIMFTCPLHEVYVNNQVNKRFKLMKNDHQDELLKHLAVYIGCASTLVNLYGTIHMMTPDVIDTAFQHTIPNMLPQVRFTCDTTRAPFFIFLDSVTSLRHQFPTQRFHVNTLFDVNMIEMKQTIVFCMKKYQDLLENGN